MAIWSEMNRASQKYPALYHQRFSDPMLVGPDLISEEAFAAFQGMFPDKEWASWERTPDGSYWGRFHGKKDGLDEFERLAESAYLVLQEFNSELPEGHGFHGWLNVIHDMARDFPTPLLRTRYGVWGIDPQPTDDKFDEVVNLWENSAAARFRPHPFFNQLVHNVFTSSMSAIELILAPEKALLVGEWLEDLPALLSSFDDEPSQEDESLKMPQLSDVRVALIHEQHSEVTAVAVTHPIIEIEFDETTTSWNFKYDFAGVKEYGGITMNLKGFQLYRTILERDGKERMSSLEFWKAAGLRTRNISYASGGTVDADAESRDGVFDADDEPLVLHGGSQEEMLDEQGKQEIDKLLRTLKSDLGKCMNSERREEIEREIQTVEAWRRKMLNIRGKSRTLVVNDEEKARKRITHLLATARDKLANKLNMPTLAYFLSEYVTNSNGWAYDSRRSLLLLKRNSPQT